MSTRPIIDFRQVSKRFGDKTVYDRMDLQVMAGETLTIIGGSGEGKSVCLKMMIGLLRPDGGQVLFGDQSVPDLDEDGLRRVRSKVAYVFQGGALFDSMTVGENIGFALREHTDWSEARIHQRALECLDMVGLAASVAAQMPSRLSGGMKKRVALARSIAIEPEVILYDEPTTGLDPKNITRIGDMIIKLQRELGVTSVVVTHDMPTAHKVSDRIAMLYRKKFPFVGAAEQMWHSTAPQVRDFIHGRIRRAGESNAWRSQSAGQLDGQPDGPPSGDSLPAGPLATRSGRDGGRPPGASRAADVSTPAGEVDHGA